MTGKAFGRYYVDHFKEGIASIQRRLYFEQGLCKNCKVHHHFCVLCSYFKNGNSDVSCRLWFTLRLDR